MTRGCFRYRPTEVIFFCFSAPLQGAGGTDGAAVPSDPRDMAEHMALCSVHEAEAGRKGSSFTAWEFRPPKPLLCVTALLSCRPLPAHWK